MYRYPTILALTALLAASLLVSASTVHADDAGAADDYYEDEYGYDDDAAAADDEAEEAEEVVEEVPDRFKYVRSGFYMYGGGVGIHESLPAAQMANDAVGVNFRFGARYLRYIATEFEYQTVPNWNVTLLGTDPERSEADIDVHSFTVNAKAYYPWGRLQPFGQFGIGLALAQAAGVDHDTGFEWRAGGGLELFVTENFTMSMAVLYTRSEGTTFILPSFEPDPVYVEIDYLRYTSVVWAVGYHF